MRMFNPPPPCEILREDVLPDRSMSVADFAAQLGYDPAMLQRVLNNEIPINADLAIRLEKAGISSAEMWLGLQNKYDLWQLRNNRPQREAVAAIIDPV